MKTLFALSLIVAAFAQTAHAEIKGESVEYRDGTTVLKGYIAHDTAAKGKRPAVLVFPEWWGNNDYAHSRARQLAGLGYIAFAVDMYGHGLTTTDPAQAKELTAPFYESRKLMRSRAEAGLKALSANPDVDASRISAIGYCFGGTTALELGRSGAEVKSIVSFHGGLANPTPADDKNIRAKVLVLNGKDDPMVPEADREALKKSFKQSGVSLKFIDYPGAVHAFTNPKADTFKIPGVGYNKAADQASWEEMKKFLAESSN